MGDVETWQCWSLRYRPGVASATIVLVFEGQREDALASQALHGEQVTFVEREADLEKVYQTVFATYPGVARVYASRWEWSRS